MFSKKLIQAEHVQSFTISDVRQNGWEVRVEQDGTVVRQIYYTDWHRVERALRAIEQEVNGLQDNGWREVSSDDDLAYSTKR